MVRSCNASDCRKFFRTGKSPFIGSVSSHRHSCNKTVFPLCCCREISLHKICQFFCQIRKIIQSVFHVRIGAVIYAWHNHHDLMLICITLNFGGSQIRKVVACKSMQQIQGLIFFVFSESLSLFSLLHIFHPLLFRKQNRNIYLHPQDTGMKITMYICCHLFLLSVSLLQRRQPHL